MSAGPDSRDDRAHWEARYVDRDADVERAASTWVVEQCLALPTDSTIVDIAGGVGRHAVPIARAGRTVIVVDFVYTAIRTATQRDPRILGAAADVRALPIRVESVDAILCVNFLDRGVVPTLVRLLRPGGALVYETFTRRHLELVRAGRARGPRNPAYLLDDGELRALVAPLVVREYAEGLVMDGVGERHVARVVAVKACGSGVARRETVSPKFPPG